MIAKLIIANLKGFASRTDIDLAPLTLLYGENSAGKSTILQALRLLREIHVDNTAQRVRGMPFRDLVTNGNTNMPLSLGFECAFDSSASASDILNLCWLSAIEWDPSASLPRLTEIEAYQVFLRHFPVFSFNCVDDMLVNDFYLPSRAEMRALRDQFDIHVDTVRQAVERLVEARVMQNYLETHAEKANSLNKAISAVVWEPYVVESCGHYLGTLISIGEFEFWKTLRPIMVSDPVTDEERGGAVLLDDFTITDDHKIEEDNSKARALLAKWRGNLPEWITACPPGWEEYRRSEDYARETQAICSTIFSDILDLCDNPKSFDPAETRIRCELSSPPTQDLKIREGLFHHLRDAMSDPYIVIDSRPSRNGCPVSVHIERRTERISEFWKVFDAIIETTKRKWEEHFQITMQGLESIKHVPPLREPPKRIYERDGGDGSVASELAHSEALVAAVNIWLERLGVDYVVEIHDLAPGSGYFRVLLSDRRRPDVPAVNYADTGFGVSQLLPIMVAGLTGRNQTILVEQPELHIHPRLQAELGSFFAECIKERGHQFIVETHSEHIMLRVQTLLRQEQLNARDVGVRYVCRTECGSSVQNLRVDDDGDFLDPWPGGFFPERYNEVLHS